MKKSNDFFSAEKLIELFIKKALDEVDGNQARVAKLLAIPKATLRFKRIKSIVLTSQHHFFLILNI